MLFCFPDQLRFLYRAYRWLMPALALAARSRRAFCFKDLTSSASLKTCRVLFRCFAPQLFRLACFALSLVRLSGLTGPSDADSFMS